jgi:hypothetical protein
MILPSSSGGGGRIASESFLTIGLSVVLHGLTATPLTARYAAWFAAHPREAEPRFESVPFPHSAFTGGLGCGTASGPRRRLTRDVIGR